MSATAERPELLVFSPLPPRRNGIADYSADLLSVLAESFVCTAVVEDGDFEATAPEGVAVIQRLDYLANRDAFKVAPHLYHVGNNPDHIYMLDIMTERPGVVVLHDPSLHHLVHAATLAKGDRDAYAAALTSEYGWAGAVLADQFARYGLHEHRMHSELPMIRGIAGSAHGIIVHSRWAADRVRQLAPAADVTIINHYVRPASVTSGYERGAFRARHGIPMDEFVISSMGFVTRAKQIDLVLRSLADAASALPPFRYVVAGESQPGELDVLGEAARVGLQDRTLYLGYLDEAEIGPLLAATDLFINLRFPTLGETSGTVMRALAYGTCTIVNDVGAFRDIPRDAAIQLPWDPAIRGRLRDAIVTAAGSAEMRATIGTAAARWCREACSLEQCGGAYAAVLDCVRDRTPRPWNARPNYWARPSRAALGAAETPGPLWQTAGMLPDPSGCEILAILDDEADATILTGCCAEASLTTLLVTGDDVPFDRLADGSDRRFDLALLVLSAGRVEANIGAVLRRLNALLGFGGVLVAEIRGGESGSHILLRDGSGRSALRQAGFDIEGSAVAAPVSLTVLESPLDRRVWNAVKVSEFTTPPPALPAVSLA